MSITATSVRYAVRPRRVLFAADDTSLLDVFRAACRLWGGIYNPVVLVSDRDDPNDPNLRVEETARRFDVDAIVAYADRPVRRHWEIGRPGIVGPDFIDFLMPAAPFVRTLIRNGASLDAPNLPHEDLLAAARFGQPTQWSGAVGVNIVSHPVTDLDDDIRWYPIQTTRYRLSAVSTPLPAQYVLFLLDPRNSGHVVQFWNLRAAGPFVYPIPLTEYSLYRDSIATLQQRATIVFGGGESQTNLSVIAASGTSAGVIDEFEAWWRDETKTDVRLRTQAAPQAEYPWCFNAGTTAKLVVLDNGVGEFTVDPLPIDLEPQEAQKGYAADLPYLVAIGEHLFWLPDAGPTVAGTLLHSSADWRLGKTGLVKLHSGLAGTGRLKGATIRDVTIAEARDAGIEWIATSSPGLALDRIVAHMGGNLEDADLLCFPGVRDLLQRLEGGIDTLPAGDVVAALNRANHDTTTSQTQFDTLFAKQVLRAGLVLQCERCARRAWYLVGTFGVSFRCHWCFAENVALRPDQLKWHYRSDGLFMLEGRMAGCLAVLSALIFLERFLVWFSGGGYGLSRLMWLPSFEYRAAGATREIDFAVASPHRDHALIVGEVKSGGPIDEDQLRACAELVRASGAYLALCTLGPDFTEEEKRSFVGLGQSGVRLILLTQKHLNLRSMGVSNFAGVSDYRVRGAEQLSRTSVRQVLEGHDLPLGPYR